MGRRCSASRRMMSPAEVNERLPACKICDVADFAGLVTLCHKLEDTPARLEKLRLVAEFLRALPASDVATAVAFLTGRAFPPSDPRALGVRWLPAVDELTAGPPLGFGDVASAFAAVAETQGPGARQSKEHLLRQLLARASAGEREIRSEEHTSELQSRLHLVCRLLLEKKKKQK